MTEEIKKRKRKRRVLYGEDVEILRERRNNNRSRRPNVCDTHIDGA